MSDAPSAHATVAAPRRRGCALRALLVLLVAALVAGGVVLLLAPSLRWSVQATAAPPDDDEAWAHVPGGKPIVAALDVRSLLDSPVARAVHADLARAAAAQGFDLALAQRNARLLVLVSDGRGFASGAATGPRLSPALLPRFDPRWRLVATTEGEVVTDGSAVIRALKPGLVAYAVSESGQDATLELQASLAAAARGAQAPLPLDGASFAVVVTPDDALRRRMATSVPREAAPYVLGIQSVSVRAVAGDTLDTTIRLAATSDDAAAATAGALAQLDQILSTGLASFLAPFLGEDAKLLSKIPPFDVTREGRDVVVTLSATPDHLRALLAEVK